MNMKESKYSDLWTSINVISDLSIELLGIHGCIEMMLPDNRSDYSSETEALNYLSHQIVLIACKLDSTSEDLMTIRNELNKENAPE